MRVELTSLGSRLYAHCSALGKVLLAYRFQRSQTEFLKAILRARRMVSERLGHYGARVDSIQSRRIGQ